MSNGEKGTRRADTFALPRTLAGSRVEIGEAAIDLLRVDVTLPGSAVRQVLPHEAESTGGGGVGEQ